jgi:hypothetical protein
MMAHAPANRAFVPAKSKNGFSKGLGSLANEEKRGFIDVNFPIKSSGGIFLGEIDLICRIT